MIAECCPIIILYTLPQYNPLSEENLFCFLDFRSGGFVAQRRRERINIVL
jgi:hypothetical protein